MSESIFFAEEKLCGFKPKTAILGFLFLKERISFTVWISIIVAAFGICVMAFGNTEKNSLMGLIFGLASALGFSIFSVSLRWRKRTPKFTTVALAGLFCFLFSMIVCLLLILIIK